MVETVIKSEAVAPSVVVGPWGVTTQHYQLTSPADPASALPQTTGDAFTTIHLDPAATAAVIDENGSTTAAAENQLRHTDCSDTAPEQHGGNVWQQL